MSLHHMSGRSASSLFEVQSRMSLHLLDLSSDVLFVEIAAFLAIKL
jgi:hypothetical protein